MKSTIIVNFKKMMSMKTIVSCYKISLIEYRRRESSGIRKLGRAICGYRVQKE
jgi:hypothetical protein